MKNRNGFVTNSSSSSFILKNRPRYGHENEPVIPYNKSEVSKTVKTILSMLKKCGAYSGDIPKRGEDYIVISNKSKECIRKYFYDWACWDSDEQVECMLSRDARDKLNISEYECEKCPIRTKCDTLTDIAADGDVVIIGAENSIPEHILYHILSKKYHMTYYNLHMG